LEHPRQGFLPARNVWSLNPRHFDSRCPEAKCVFELENKQSGERSSSADTVVSPTPESALVVEADIVPVITNCLFQHLVVSIMTDL
jgi:hypothetical protein